MRVVMLIAAMAAFAYVAYIIDLHRGRDHDD